MDTGKINLSVQTSGGASFDELAASQGVHPIMDFDALRGHSSNDDESAEEFSATLREWRNEGVASQREA